VGLISPDLLFIRVLIVSLNFISALLRQSNSNWKAFYVLTEKPVFSKMLRAILNSYNDPRLSYLPVDGRLLTKVTPVHEKCVRFIQDLHIPHPPTFLK